MKCVVCVTKFRGFGRETEYWDYALDSLSSLAETDPEEVAVRNEYWPSEPPVSATVQVARLVSDEVRIEVEAMAVVLRGGLTAIEVS